MVMISTINLDLHRQHALEGTSRKRVKRSFGVPVNDTDSDRMGGRLEPDGADAVETEEEGDFGGSFAALRGRLLADLEADEDHRMTTFGNLAPVEQTLPSVSPVFSFFITFSYVTLSVILGPFLQCSEMDAT